MLDVEDVVSQNQLVRDSLHILKHKSHDYKSDIITVVYNEINGLKKYFSQWCPRPEVHRYVSGSFVTEIFFFYFHVAEKPKKEKYFCNMKLLPYFPIKNHLME